MARFGSTVAFVVDGKRHKAGQTYCDSKANQLAGDIIWTGMSSSTMSPGLVPLDGSAVSMKAGSVYSGIQTNLIDGANSIGA
jgi:hypothetical protein